MDIDSHRPQIKTRARVRELAEVYTHEREVRAMLDLAPEAFDSIDSKFLEPACGSGNFVEEILRRKLAGIRFSAIGDVNEYEHRLLRAVASIYALDICAENVFETRERLLAEVRSHYYNDANTIEPTEEFVRALRAILTSNVLRADFLAEASTLELIDYRPAVGQRFMRKWSVLDESASALMQPDLFHQEAEERADERPVHYSLLASHAEPIRDAYVPAATAAAELA